MRAVDTRCRSVARCTFHADFPEPAGAGELIDGHGVRGVPLRPARGRRRLPEPAAARARPRGHRRPRRARPGDGVRPVGLRRVRRVRRRHGDDLPQRHRGRARWSTAATPSGCGSRTAATWRRSTGSTRSPPRRSRAAASRPTAPSPMRSMLLRARGDAGRVLVVGAGGLGQFAIRYLRVLTDATVVALDRAADKQQRGARDRGPRRRSDPTPVPSDRPGRRGDRLHRRRGHARRPAATWCAGAAS